MAKIEVELAPFDVPEAAFAIEHGFGEARLTQIPAETLDEMAGDWLDALYDMAGKDNPWRRV